MESRSSIKRSMRAYMYSNRKSLETENSPTLNHHPFFRPVKDPNGDRPEHEVPRALGDDGDAGGCRSAVEGEGGARQAREGLKAHVVAESEGQDGEGNDRAGEEQENRAADGVHQPRRIDHPYQPCGKDVFDRKSQGKAEGEARESPRARRADFDTEGGRCAEHGQGKEEDAGERFAEGLRCDAAEKDHGTAIVGHQWRIHNPMCQWRADVEQVVEQVADICVGQHLLQCHAGFGATVHERSPEHHERQ